MCAVLEGSTPARLRCPVAEFAIRLGGERAWIAAVRKVSDARAGRRFPSRCRNALLDSWQFSRVVVRRFVGRFVDDLHGAESEGQCEGQFSARAVTQLVIEGWLGWKFEDKHVDRAAEATVLRVNAEFSVTERALACKVNEVKLEMWLWETHDILAQGRCSPP